MFSWGQDSQRGFVLRRGSDPCRSTCCRSDSGVHHLDLGCLITDLSAGFSVLAFVKNNGNAFILRTNESKDGRRVRGKQKFVKCKEPIEAASCQDDVVTFLSDRGSVFCVDTTRTPYTPRILEVFTNIPVAQVSCGSQHSVALTRDGQVYTWGQDSRGQLGLGRRNSGAGSPQHLRALASVPVVRISAGGERSFALSVSGGVFGWGRNDCGQLGLGDTKDRYTPTCVHSLNLKKSWDVSCGKDHTAVLTKHGAVFTFGSGRHGQLGHNSFQDERRPRLVAELWGVKAVKVACGRNHTLVLTDANKVYSFGCGDDGQLGHGEESHPSVPLPVSLPRDADSPRVQSIFAAENCSFAACGSDEDVRRDGGRKVAQSGLEGLVQKWVSECDSKSWKKIQQEIHRTFSSAACLNKSFLEQRDKHFQTSSQHHGLNFKLARQNFRKLVKKGDVWEEAEAAVLRLLPALDRNPVGVESLRVFLLLNELLHVLQKHTKQQNTKLAEVLAAAVTGLSFRSLRVLGNWWSSLSPSTMGRFITAWNQALSLIFTYDPVPRSAGVRNLLQVLQYMYNVNSRVSASRRLPERAFYLPIHPRFLYDDLNMWRLRSQLKFGRAEPLVLCSFPMVLDLRAKKHVFDMNVRITVETFQLSVVERIIQEFFWDLGVYHLVSEFLELDVSRASVLKDAFDQLAAVNQKDYRRQLVVHFDGNFVNDPVYLKDFFHEVFHEILSLESEMFMFNDSETLAWFSSRSGAGQEDRRWYLFGVLCGLALYNQAIIYFPFPLVLFKKLLGLEPSLEDLIEFNPTVGRSLQYILNDYPDDDLVDLDMDFTISWEAADVDLDPGNPNKQVTSQNKEEFVEAYVNHAFNTSVETVFEDFTRGFFHVCDRDLVRLFGPAELQEILVGKDFHDWEKLKQNTRYEREYHADHANIQMFWEVFDELTENHKKAFLWFVTGFERVPVLGLDTIKMTIRVKRILDLSYDQYYPETHTCDSVLELPLYSDKEILRSKLTEALSNNNRINK